MSNPRREGVPPHCCCTGPHGPCGPLPPRPAEATMQADPPIPDPSTRSRLAASPPGQQMPQCRRWFVLCAQSASRCARCSRASSSDGLVPLLVVGAAARSCVRGPSCCCCCCCCSVGPLFSGRHPPRPRTYLFSLRRYHGCGYGVVVLAAAVAGGGGVLPPSRLLQHLATTSGSAAGCWWWYCCS